MINKNKQNMTLLSKIKANIVWIVFVVVSFFSTVYLTGEFIEVQNYSANSIKQTTTISTDRSEDNKDYESNDHQIIETIGAILLKFFKS
jgi:hypothetical protein